MFLTSQQNEFRETVRDFALREVQPEAVRIDREETFPVELVKRMGERGLMGIPYPEQYDGAGLDTVCYALAVEELSRVCGSTGITLAAHISLGTSPIYEFGTAEQKRRYLPRLCRGETLGAFGLTEPGAGSDAGGTKTWARRDGDEWVVNGSKMWITNAGYSDVLVITALTDREQRVISSFLVEKCMPGYVIGPSEKKLGLRGSDTHALSFEDLHLPAEHLLGELGDGFRQALSTLNGGRISVGAMAVGLAQGALDAALSHSESRVQFGRPAARNQAIQFYLADMATRTEAARHLVLNAARMKDAGKPYIREGAMAKLFASETASFCADRAIQILGAAGYSKDHEVERIYRDAKLCEIGEGTSEIQRLVIVRQLLGGKKANY